MLTPPVAGHSRRLVQIEHLDHEQYQKADPGMEEVAPKPVETGTFCLLRFFRNQADGGHVYKQHYGGKDGQRE